MRKSGTILTVGLSLPALVVAFTLVLAETPPVVPQGVRGIIKQNCAVSGCHSGRYPAANLNLEAEKFPASAVDVPSSEASSLKIISTTEPEKSYLLAKVKGDSGIVGGRMPLGRTPLSKEQIQQLETWIQSLKKK